jgi:hypothetical protein
LNTLVTPQRLVSKSPLAGVWPAVIVVAVLGSRLAGRLWGNWAIGALGGLFILLRGQFVERALLLFLIFLSVFAGGEQIALGLRGVLFISMFMVLARYVEINPWLLLIAQLFGLAISMFNDIGILFELFVFAPSMLFIILSVEILRENVKKQNIVKRILAFVFTIIALAIPSLGGGSRSALFVWSAVNIRRLRFIYIIALGGVVVAAIPVLVALKDLQVVQKLGNSITEIAEPIDPETGGVSQRAIENLLFLDYIISASDVEVLFGSTRTILLDGAPLGQDKDVQFVPHNQIFGMIFQFGVLGFGFFLYYVYGLLKYFSADPFCAFFLAMLLLPGFLLKGGVYDGDLALLAASLNWVRRRHLTRTALVLK